VDGSVLPGNIVVLVQVDDETVARITLTPNSPAGLDVQLEVTDPQISGAVVGAIREAATALEFADWHSGLPWNKKDPPAGDFPF